MLGTEIVGSAVAAEANIDRGLIVNNINQIVNYAHDLNKHYKRLTNIAEKLSARKEDIVAEANKYKTKQFTRECQVWMSTVTKSEEVVQKLKTKYEKALRKKWLWRAFHHRFRAKLSKSMAEKCDELHNLWSEANFERGIMVEKLPECVRIMHAPKIEDKPSLHCIVGDILSLLRDVNVKKIGLWGMAGIGKTTIMQNLNDNEDIARMFDIVIWVNVSQDWSVEKLQHVIIDRLELNVEGITNVAEIAWRISKELEYKRYLLLLDEVWHILDLEEIGIYGNQMDSKVVLATRYRNICHEMDELINVKRMSEDDAWKMFKEKVGQHINIPGIEPIAKLVVRECAGLPLLIDRVASTFRIKDNFHLWHDGLMRLRRQRSIKVQGMDEIEFLKFCYEDLDDDDAVEMTSNSIEQMEFDSEEIGNEASQRQPEFIQDEAMERAISTLEPQGVVFDDEAVEMTSNSSEQMEFDGEEIGNEASQRKPEFIQDEEMERAISTLDPQGEVFDVEALKMPRSSRQIEFQIKDNEMEHEADRPEEARLFLMQGGLGLTEPPKDEDWENAKVMNLMDNELSVLPENPRCPKLSALFLKRNYKLRIIPPSFFDYMPALQILNLSRTGIKSLPNSIIRLVNLKRLFLNDCHCFMMLSPKVGELKQLEVLDLEGTEIMDLPQEIKKLTNLTCLEVSFCEYMSDGKQAMQSNAVIPCGVISELSQLEELNIDVNPEDDRWDTHLENIVKEVCVLNRLETLKFYFPRVELLRQFLCNSPLQSNFRFTVGCYVKRIISRVPPDVEFELGRWERCLIYINGEDVPGDIKKVLQHVTAFFLDRHATVKKLSNFGIRNMMQLKCLVMGECNEVQVIIDEADVYEEDDISKIVSDSYATEKIVLGSLEYLYIYYMKSLRSIWEGSVQQNSLILLRSLTLCTCPQLTVIFSQGLLANLCNLEELKVKDCPSVNSIVSCKIFPEDLTSYFLPNLKKISLHYMTGLDKISSGLHIAPKLEWLSFYGCPNLKNPFIDEIFSQDLKKIKGERIWWEALEWSNGCPAYLDKIFVPIDDIWDC